MHPRQGSCHDHEHQHKAALPDACEVVQYAKGQWQDESSKSANHANHAAYSADVHGVVDRNVLVHGCLAEGHEESEDKDQRHEQGQVYGQGKADVAINALDHVIGGRIAQQKRAQNRGAEGPVHDPAGAEAV